MVKVAVAQMAAAETMEENYEKSLRFMKEASEGGARLLVFPEGQFSHYIPQYENRNVRDFSMPLDHPYIRGLRGACRKFRLAASLGICLAEDRRVYAADLMVSETGELLAVGKKNHIVRAPHYYEQDYFTPGPGGFAVADTSCGRVGLIVCFDRHYPESYRTLVRKGADLIRVPVANEKAEPCEMFEWEIRVAAYQNSVSIIMANRVGTEENMVFSGESIAVGPNGELAAKADDTEQLLFAELDLDAGPKIRTEKQYLPLLREDAFF